MGAQRGREALSRCLFFQRAGKGWGGLVVLDGAAGPAVHSTAPSQGLRLQKVQ